MTYKSRKHQSICEIPSISGICSAKDDNENIAKNKSAEKMLAKLRPIVSEIDIDSITDRSQPIQQATVRSNATNTRDFIANYFKNNKGDLKFGNSRAADCINMIRQAYPGFSFTEVSCTEGTGYKCTNIYSDHRILHIFLYFCYLLGVLHFKCIIYTV